MKVKVKTPFYCTELGLCKVDDILEVGNMNLGGLVIEIPEDKPEAPETRPAAKKETRKAKQA